MIYHSVLFICVDNISLVAILKACQVWFCSTKVPHIYSDSWTPESYFQACKGNLEPHSSDFVLLLRQRPVPKKLVLPAIQAGFIHCIPHRFPIEDPTLSHTMYLHEVVEQEGYAGSGEFNLPKAYFELDLSREAESGRERDMDGLYP